MGRWLKKISETGGIPTDKTDKGGSVSVVSALPPHFQKKNTDVYSDTRGVLTDNADKGGSVSVVSTLPPHIQKTQVIDQVTRQLNADRHMVLALLSDDDQEQIGAGLITASQLADYLNAMKADRKPLVDPQWHLDRLMEQVANRRRQNADDTADWRESWETAHELFINHVMDCSACRAPQGHYCKDGQQYRQTYLDTHQAKAGERSSCSAR
jgi:hypothetical protein